MHLCLKTGNTKEDDNGSGGAAASGSHYLSLNNNSVLASLLTNNGSFLPQYTPGVRMKIILDLIIANNNNNDNAIMSDDIPHYCLDSVDLEKTLMESPLMEDDDDDGMMEARVVLDRREGEGGNDNDDDDMGGEALLNALGINDWNVQYDASLDTITNMGWLQSVVMDALGFGSDGVTGDHALETPGPSVRDDGALSPVPTGTPTSSSSAADGVPNNNNNIPPLSLDATIVEPSPEDILLGRGKNVQYHPGNVKFREWLEEYREEYERTPRSKKRRIATEMVQILSSNGIRFLKQCSTNKNSWVVVDSKEAEEKISQLFRSRRKKQQQRE